MFAKTRTINRQNYGKNIQHAMDVPDLIAIQTKSYDDFLQAEALKEGKEVLNQGLQDVFTSTFPYQFEFPSDWSNSPERYLYG